MSRSRRLISVLVLLTFIVGCDQMVKWIARSELAGRRPISLLGGLVHLVYTQNPGAILGLGGGLPIAARFLIFGTLVGLTLAVLVIFTLSSTSITAAQLTGLALIAGGALGNLIDRVIFQGQVVDFIVLGADPLQTGIFNLADVAIFLGAGILLLSILAARKGERSAAA